MRRFSWVAVLVLAISLLAGVREARALPTNEVDDTFYDCALNELGWKLLSCNGHIYTSGLTSGAYRYRVLTSCDTGGGSANWYYWTGSSWAWISSPPGPNC
ncbi:MAG TPA: hypothetical protein VM733_16995 [Thermoanaerobaculia bacterium]|nr:hypothetical protein [Thermoanaerobaculia bacterium]